MNVDAGRVNCGILPDGEWLIRRRRARYVRAMIIDVHTHAFPDQLAARAMAQLQAETDQVIAVLDGTVGDLLKSMDRAGIAASVVASIATKPTQFDSILRWSDTIRSERIIPFPSLCPKSDGAVEQVRRVAAEGFRGIKLHPYYQQFLLDDERVFPVYDAAEECGLVILMHCGFDIAFPRERVADPARLARVLERFPQLKVIAAHLGAWMDWDEVEVHLLGRPVYLDVSTCFDFMKRDQAERILRGHPADYLLFGSDSPWVDQLRTLEQLRSIALGTAVEAAVEGGNAAELLLGT
jgi:predicted TIM-barrel fold metal-dependent hydrolase